MIGAGIEHQFDQCWIMLDVLDDLDAGFDRAHAVDHGVLSDAEVEKGWQRAMRLAARAEALAAQLAAACDARQIGARLGARSTAAYAARTFDLPIEETRRHVHLGRKLRALPGVGASMAAGAIQSCHVRAVLGCDTPRTHDALVAEHVTLVRAAIESPWPTFRRALLGWMDEHDPDGADPGGSSRRRFRCSPTFEGGYALDGWLPAVAGTIVARELGRLERQLFEADWAEARERLGYEPLVHQLRRSPAQRFADALVRMAERSAVEPRQHRRGRAVFIVHVGHDGFENVCRLTNGIEVRPGDLVDHLTDAWIQRVVFDGAGEPVQVSDQRLFRGKLRRAIEARDQECFHPYCHEPIDGCEVDHIIPAAAGGPTSRSNGRLACGSHNRGRHRRRSGVDPPAR